MRRRLLLPALLLALTAGSAGCSGDPEPIIEPAPSTTPAASPTASEPTPTAEPESESAKEFIRRWQREAYEMQISGDTTLYRASTRQCDGCDALANLIDEVYDDGGSVETGPTEVARLVRVGGQGGVKIYEFDLLSEPTQVIAADGQILQDLPGGRGRFQLNLVEQRDSWKVVRLVQLEI